MSGDRPKMPVGGCISVRRSMNGWRKRLCDRGEQPSAPREVSLGTAHEGSEKAMRVLHPCWWSAQITESAMTSFDGVPTVSVCCRRHPY